MIVTNDISNILFTDCKVFGIAEIYRRGYVPDVPEKGLQSERVVILPKSQTPEKIWIKDFVEVNLCVPDVADGMADIIRLQELERMAKKYLDRVTGTYDGTRYRYSISDIDGTAEDKAIKCHYVNVRLLFNVLNVN